MKRLLVTQALNASGTPSLRQRFMAALFALVALVFLPSLASARDEHCPAQLNSECLFKKAEELARNMPPAARHLSLVAIARTEVGDLEGALQVIADIPPYSPERDDILRRLAVAVAAKGQEEEMLELINGIGVPRHQEIALRESVVALTESGHIAEARIYLERFTLPEDRATLFAALGLAEYLAGQQSAADEAFEEAISSIKVGETALSSLAIALVRANRIDAAREIADRLSPGTALYAVQISLVIGLLEKEQLQAALETGAAIENKGLKEAAYLKIYTWLLENDRVQEADELAGNRLAGPDDRKVKMAKARSLAKRGETEASFEVAKSLSAHDLSPIHYAVGRSRLDNGLLEEAEKSAALIVNGRLRQDLLRFIALAQLKAGNDEKAITLISEIEVERMRLIALLDLAKSLAAENR